MFERGIQRGGFTGTGGPGYQHDTVGPRGHGLPAFPVFLAEAQLLEGFEQYLRVKNPHHHFFAERRWHGGQAQLHFAVIGFAGLDAAVLGPSFLGYVQAPEDFQAAGHGHANVFREFVDIVQHPVDPEPHLGNRAPGLYMNVGGSLLEGILQQPVNDFDHMLVVGVRIFAGAQVQ